MAAKILIIDDGPDVARGIARMLRAYDTTTETEPRAAVARFVKGERFDIVLCDLEMPGMSGREVYQKLRDQRFDPPPIMLMMSGHANVANLFAAGCPVLFKPFTQAELRALIASLLHEASTSIPSQHHARS